MGPKGQIHPKELGSYETRGGFVVEEKNDGHWCEVITDATGKVIRVGGRSGKPFANANVEGILGMQTHLPDTVLVGELEAGTEAALMRHQRIGFHRVHLFDMVKLMGLATVELPYEKRRELLEMALAKSTNGDFISRFRVTRRAAEGFVAFYNKVIEEGGEGLVLKRLGTKYKPHGASGKTEEWVKVKAQHFVDYVVMSVGKSSGGSDNLQVGLFIQGTLQRVCGIKQPPTHLRLHELVGKVIECRGAEVHQSGALRHGHFERIRTDKSPAECTLEAALNAV
jgi:ATP-dependent DNA ligase